MSNDANDTTNARHFKAVEPDAYDRAYGQAQGFPHTKPSTITVANLMGIGGVRSYIVETFRTPELGDTVFVQIAGPEGLQRVHIPPSVTNVIARQRDSLTMQSRSRSAKSRAAADKAAGIKPGFKLTAAERAERAAARAAHKKRRS
jgi:hypothetical protein